MRNDHDSRRTRCYEHKDNNLQKNKVITWKHDESEYIEINEEKKFNSTNESKKSRT